MPTEGTVIVCVALTDGTVSEARGTVCVVVPVTGATGFVVAGAGTTVGCGEAVVRGVCCVVGRAAFVCGDGETVVGGLVVRGRISCGAGGAEGG